jgi:hypothetical protein
MATSLRRIGRRLAPRSSGAFWRQLRRLGALYLHKSVCLLPNRPEVRAALQPILLRVKAQGGSVRNLTIQIEGSAELTRPREATEARLGIRTPADQSPTPKRHV